MIEFAGGTRIGKYEIINQLVLEANRSLYLAEDDAGQQVLLEIYHDKLKKSVSLRLKTLQGLALTHILEIGTTQSGQTFVVYPFAQGHRLADLLTENPAAFSTEQSLVLAQQLATTLAATHEKEIYHTDIHPENIWITGEETAVFLGWGFQAQAQNRTIPANQLGYTAPEINKISAHSPQSNIFSIGILLFTLLAHHPPTYKTEWDIFTTDEKTQIILLENSRAGLASETYLLVRNCLWRQPWSRYDSMQDLLTALELALHAESPNNKQKNKNVPLPSLSIPTFQLRTIVIGIGLVLVLGLVYFFREPLTQTGSESTNTAVPAQIQPEETGLKTAVPSPTPASTDTPIILVEPELPAATSVPNTNTPSPTTAPTRTPSPTNPAVTPTSTSTVAPAGTNTPTPTTPPTATQIDACTPFKPEGWVIYTIKADDALFNLAIQTGTTVAYVQEINCLTSDSLSIGQTIFLPTQPIVNSPTPLPTDPPSNSGSRSGGNSGGGGGGGAKATRTPPPP